MNYSKINNKNNLTQFYGKSKNAIAHGSIDLTFKKVKQ